MADNQDPNRMDTEIDGSQTAAKSLDEILASIPPDSRPAVMAALQQQTTPAQPAELTEQQKADLRAERQRFQEAIANLDKQLGEAGGPSTVTASGVNSR